MSRRHLRAVGPNERPSISDVATDRADNSYPDAGDRCFVCGGRARSFSSDTVPDLLRYLGGQIGAGELRHAAGAGDRCMTAPRCGLSLCRTGKVNL
jgi:hypothetical protein